MTKRLAILVFALLPLSASAQPAPLRIGAGIGTGGIPAITVAGYGSVRYAVKTVSFVAFVRGQADEAATISAMRSAGIEDAVIGPAGSQISLNGAGSATVRGTIRDVSTAKLERIGLAALAYAHAHSGVSIENVNFVPRYDDCAPHEQAARAAAFAEARRKAQAVADLAGVTIEGVLSVSEGGGCPVQFDGPYGNGGAFDLSTLTTSVNVNENVSFSIVQGPPAARRRTL